MRLNEVKVSLDKYGEVWLSDDGFNSFEGHESWIGDECDQQRELSEDEMKSWYAEPEELKF